MNQVNELVNRYLSFIINGKRPEAEKLCLNYIEGDNSIKSMYEDIMKPALYKVGELWEQNKISVATEHLATAISEGILNSVYSQVIPDEYSDKKVVLACVENENHQVGIKMVADIFEMNNWESFFLGAGFPTSELIKFTNEKKPDVIAISLSVYFNYKVLVNTIQELRNSFPDLPIIVGGQALLHLEDKINNSWENVFYISSLNELEEYIKTF